MAFQLHCSKSEIHGSGVDILWLHRLLLDRPGDSVGRVFLCFLPFGRFGRAVIFCAFAVICARLVAFCVRSACLFGRALICVRLRLFCVYVA